MAGVFVDAENRAALGNLWRTESAGEEKTLRDTRRRLDSEDAAHVTWLRDQDTFQIGTCIAHQQK